MDRGAWRAAVHGISKSQTRSINMLQWAYNEAPGLWEIESPAILNLVVSTQLCHILRMLFFQRLHPVLFPPVSVQKEDLGEGMAL